VLTLLPLLAVRLHASAPPEQAGARGDAWKLLLRLRVANSDELDLPGGHAGGPGLQPVVISHQGLSDTDLGDLLVPPITEPERARCDRAARARRAAGRVPRPGTHARLQPPLHAFMKSWSKKHDMEYRCGGGGGWGPLTGPLLPSALSYEGGVL